MVASALLEDGFGGRAERSRQSSLSFSAVLFRSQRAFGYTPIDFDCSNMIEAVQHKDNEEAKDRRVRGLEGQCIVHRIIDPNSLDMRKRFTPNQSARLGFSCRSMTRRVRAVIEALSMRRGLLTSRT